jgi:hypothetical protein
MFIKLTLNNLFCDGIVLDGGSCRVAGGGDRQDGGGQNSGGDGVLYEVDEGGGEVAHILYDGSGEDLVQNSKDIGLLFESRREKRPGTEDPQTPE